MGLGSSKTPELLGAIEGGDSALVKDLIESGHTVRLLRYFSNLKQRKLKFSKD